MFEIGTLAAFISLLYTTGMKTIKNFFGMQWKEGGIVADCQLMNDS